MPANQASDLVLSNEVVRTLASEVQRLRGKVAELEWERHGLNANTHGAEARSHGVQQQFDDMKMLFDARIAAFAEENSCLRQDLEATQKKLQAAETSRKDLRSNYAKVKLDLSERSSQMMAQRLEHGSVVDKLKERVSELTEELARKQVRVKPELDQDPVRIPAARARTTSAQQSAIANLGVSLSSLSGAIFTRQPAEPKKEQDELMLHTLSESDLVTGGLTATQSPASESGSTSFAEGSARDRCPMFGTTRRAPQISQVFGNYSLRPRAPVRLADTLAASNTCGCSVSRVSSNRLAHKRASDDHQSGSRKKLMLPKPSTMWLHSS
ncbi:uncharacterized protein C8Q71DRAFT_400023 [Rhodofomes roseus]|uniref:Uncharacterized protein n=1 Tax=Rhodofomes roseus TaxID=34475 RepID=A0ABQ8JZN8_9APHY|nr:uncharacterized protein C8Q71DRAFT_400023 [Rhodofomes roseus]KAH9829537.1 hypothetical protein C8Q71DRAFT_400023 [Rhodofomes roseus]